MNIFHITSTDLRGTGSCVSVLNDLLNAKGHHSRRLVVFKTRPDATVTDFFHSINPRLKPLTDEDILRFGKNENLFVPGRVRKTGNPVFELTKNTSMLQIRKTINYGKLFFRYGCI